MMTPSIPAVRPAVTPVPSVADQLQEAAEQLATQVNEGAFRGATLSSVTDLRGLSMMLSLWSDRVRSDAVEMAHVRTTLRFYGCVEGTAAASRDSSGSLARRLCRRLGLA